MSDAYDTLAWWLFGMTIGVMGGISIGSLIESRSAYRIRKLSLTNLDEEGDGRLVVARDDKGKPEYFVDTDTRDKDNSREFSLLRDVQMEEREKLDARYKPKK